MISAAAATNAVRRRDAGPSEAPRPRTPNAGTDGPGAASPPGVFERKMSAAGKERRLSRNPPGFFTTLKELRENFLPWKRPEGKYPDRDGLFITVVPTKARAATG